MKKYQIGNLTVEADSPVKALEIAKLFTKDSNIVDGVEKFYWNDVRQMCIRHNWYTHGDCAAYDRMLNAASNGQWTIDEIAFDIANHSDSSVSKAEVLTELKKIKLVDSVIKDDYPKEFIGKLLGPIAKKLKAKLTYSIINGTANAWFTPTEKEDIDKSYIFAKNVINETERHNFMGMGWDNHAFHIINNTSRWKDSDIDYLSKEEEKAIADYKAAIANTKDPKLLRLFAHILNEEIEHLEELQSETVGDSIKDSKYAIYRKHDNHYLGNGARSWVKKGSNNIDVYNSKEEALKILRAYVDDYDAEVIEIR